jgi:hypothetical protein
MSSLLQKRINRMAFENVRETCPLVDTWAGHYADQCKSSLEEEERTMNVEKRIDAWFVTFAERVQDEATTPLRNEIKRRCQELLEQEDEIQRLRDSLARWSEGQAQ